jgi:hypothetical protein
MWGPQKRAAAVILEKAAIDTNAELRYHSTRCMRADYVAKTAKAVAEDAGSMEKTA